MQNILKSRSATVAFLWRRAHLIALALFAAVGVAVLDDYGLSNDVERQRVVGAIALDYILGASDRLLQNHDYYYGVAVEVPLIVLERLLRLEDSRDVHLSRHLVTHAIFLAGGFFAWLLAYRLFRSRLVALLAMLIFLLHPRMYAHSFFNTKDLPFLAAFMISLYLVHRAFRRDSFWAFALCGAGVALTTNIRIMSVMLIPAVLGMLALDAFRAARRGDGARRPIVNAAAFIAAFAAALYAAWPPLWRDPLALVDAVRVLAVHPTLIKFVFRGNCCCGPTSPGTSYRLGFS